MVVIVLRHLGSSLDENLVLSRFGGVFKRNPSLNRLIGQVITFTDTLDLVWTTQAQ